MTASELNSIIIDAAIGVHRTMGRSGFSPHVDLLLEDLAIVACKSDQK